MVLVTKLPWWYSRQPCLWQVSWSDSHTVGRWHWSFCHSVLQLCSLVPSLARYYAINKLISCFSSYTLSYYTQIVVLWVGIKLCTWMPKNSESRKHDGRTVIDRRKVCRSTEIWRKVLVKNIFLDENWVNLLKRNCKT